ncbi:unnamed protein product [Mortierella alpina]
MKENKASIAIQAAPHEVWQVLTDLNHYHEWNPMMVHAKGTIAGESLDLKMRLPARIFCGAPVSCSWSPKVAKVEPNLCLEWSGMKGFIDRTHYFRLSSTHGGTVTEFTQGERCSGWGMGLFSSFGSQEDARRGFIAMNKALEVEAIRRKSIAEKTGSGEKEGRDKEEEIAQLDISDPAAVAASGVMKAAIPAAAEAVAAASDHYADDAVADMEDIAIAEESLSSEQAPEASSVVVEPVIVPNMTEMPMEKSEKRTSIIGAVSSLFISSKPSSTPLQPSVSKDGLISKAVLEEEDDDDEEEGGEEDNDDDEDEGGDGTVCGDLVEDADAKRERDAKNAERIELDLGLSDMDLSDFGL